VIIQHGSERAAVADGHLDMYLGETFDHANADTGAPATPTA
jgi:hypothetical protein